MYKVENDFTYKGYRCVVIFTEMGYRCGYVGVPLGHPLYKKEFCDHLDIPKSELDDEELGKRGVLSLFSAVCDDDDRIKMDLYFNVHGSLTYSGDNDGTYPVESNLWWLGFDCGHYGDGTDLDLVEKYWGDDPKIQHRIELEKEYPTREGYPIRSKEYVEQECMSLVDQIIELVERLHFMVVT